MTEAKLETKLDYYEIVRKKLSMGPLAAPKHEKTFELMKVYWDEETIKVLAHFPKVGERISLQELVEKSGLPKSHIRKILKKAIKKRTVSVVDKKYGLEPLLPGIVEAYFIVRADTEENQKKAAEVYRWIIKNMGELDKQGMYYFDKNFEMFRPVLPIEAKEKLIKIDETVSTESQVLPYELVEDMINKNEYFASIPCQCRYIGKLAGEPCEVAHDELGCFAAGPATQLLAAMGWGKALTKEEAIEYLKKTEKAGLIHCASNSYGGEHLFYICNCCSCHCGLIKPVKEHKFKTVVPSNYTPQIDPELCVLCKTCAKNCQMGAISFQEADEKMVINSDVCIGCGVCSTNCKKNAMRMVKTRNKIPPKVNKLGDKMFLEMVGALLNS
ncbi:MAG: 4Fe-4S binding protein [Candidatus Helarchaeota archaeon]|nr:4Fe-4S binding protein [Candidatus Helarchaeota archaeon]